MQKNPYAAYSSTSILSADRVTLTALLYDGSLKAVRKARRLHETGNRKGYLDELERANLILGELFASLDMSLGEIPQTLGAVYTYCMRQVVEATLNGPARLTEVEENIDRIASAWKAATAGLHSGPATQNSLANTAA